MTFYDFLVKGGIVMIPLMLCSVVAMAIALERWYYFFSERERITQWMDKMDVLLREGSLEEAEALCLKVRGPVARMMVIGLQIRERSLEEQENVLSRVGSEELRRLTGNLRILGTIAHISPLLGLLGTVTGMIGAFMKIQQLGGAVDAVVLAGGIWEALITTAAGLIVAIPAMVVYHYFEGRIDNFYARMKEATQILTERLGAREVTGNAGAGIREDRAYGL